MSKDKALFAQRGEREYMPRHSKGKDCHQSLRPPPPINHSYNAIAYGEPQQHHRDHLGTQWYGAIFAKVTNVFAQMRVVDKPLIEPR